MGGKTKKRTLPWEEIQLAYTHREDEPSYRTLEKEFGVDFRSIAKRAKKEGWTTKRKERKQRERAEAGRELEVRHKKKLVIEGEKIASIAKCILYQLQPKRDEEGGENLVFVTPIKSYEQAARTLVELNKHLLLLAGEATDRKIVVSLLQTNLTIITGIFTEVIRDAEARGLIKREGIEYCVGEFFARLDRAPLQLEPGGAAEEG